jgi:hypothetical protein
VMCNFIIQRSGKIGIAQLPLYLLCELWYLPCEK